MGTYGLDSVLEQMFLKYGNKFNDKQEEKIKFLCEMIDREKGFRGEIPSIIKLNLNYEKKLVEWHYPIKK